MKSRSTQSSITDKLYEPLVKQIFLHWQTILNHPRSLLDPVKFKVIVTQLELGHTPENLMLAIEGVAVDPWDGRRQNDALDIIFRSGNIDKFMDLGEQAKQWAVAEHEKMEKAKEIVERRSEARSEMPANVRDDLAKYRNKLMRVA